MGSSCSPGTITLEELDPKAALTLARGDHELDLPESDDERERGATGEPMKSFAERQQTSSQSRAKLLAERQRTHPQPTRHECQSSLQR